MCRSFTVTDIFSVEYCHNIEIWVRSCSRSLKMEPFESSGMVAYSHSIVNSNDKPFRQETRT